MRKKYDLPLQLKLPYLLLLLLMFGTSLLTIDLFILKNEVRQFQNLIFLRISVVEEQCAEYTPFVWVVRYSSQIFS
jgi:hypothetical protein